MGMNSHKLAALERVARLRSDMELRKFAAFRAHISALNMRIDTLRAALATGLAEDVSTDLTQMRTAAMRAGCDIRQLMDAQHELASLSDRFERSRNAAAREFGRARVVGQLRERALRDERAVRLPKW